MAKEPNLSMTNILSRSRCKRPQQHETAVGLHVECLLQHISMSAFKNMPISRYITRSLDRFVKVL